MRKVIFRVLAAAIVLGAAWGGYRLVQRLPQKQQNIPTTKVRRGDVLIRAYSRGELRAVRSVTLSAPNLFGTVQVTKLAPLGSFAREKDLVVEFDDSEVLSRLEEKQLELEQVDEQIKKAQAELAIRNNQDQVELLRARYAVRRAELEVKRNELLSKIDAEKNLLTLQEARQRLKQLESDVKSRQEQAEAEIAVLREQRNKATIELKREQERLSQTKLLSPMSGLVAIQQNRFMGGRMFGMQVPDIREGDQVQPGMPVADVLDLSELEVLAKIGELDRANLREGQDVALQLDALPDKRLHGKIKSMSGTASANIFSGDPSKKFDVTFSVDMKELLQTVGATPEQVRNILETAARNRNKPPLQMASSALPMMGTGGGLAADGGVTPVRYEARGGGGALEGGAQGMERRAGGERTPAARAGGLPVIGVGPSGPGRPGGGTGAPGQAVAPFRGPGTQFSAAELAEAKLPPPPGEGSQLEVLLRPGLLADVEITVERIRDAVYIPSQAVFEKEGKFVVYVKSGGRFEERQVRLLKRSESTMVISEGLTAGEQIAMSDPTARKSDKKKQEKPEGGAAPAGGAPAGGRS